MACIRCVVSGRVQGVWFRDSTRRIAQELNITGYALNQADGTVEVIACGETSQVEKLQAWLWQGPELAKVTSVHCDTLPEQAYSGFTIR